MTSRAYGPPEVASAAVEDGTPVETGRVGNVGNVEVPAVGDSDGLHPREMEPLPEAIAALIRTQASIHQLLVEAYAEQSKRKLLQAILLDPTVDSYRRAVAMMDEMLALQRDILPPLH